MKKAAIRDALEAHLKDIGVPATAWTFDRGRAQFIFAAGCTVRKLTLKAGMTQRSFEFAMGRIQGWWEVLSV